LTDSHTTKEIISTYEEYNTLTAKETPCLENKTLETQ